MAENQMKDRITDFRLTVLRIFSLFPLTVSVAEPCPMYGKTEFWEDFFCPVCSGQRKRIKRR